MTYLCTESLVQDNMSVAEFLRACAQSHVRQYDDGSLIKLGDPIPNPVDRGLPEHLCDLAEPSDEMVQERWDSILESIKGYEKAIQALEQGIPKLEAFRESLIKWGPVTELAQAIHVTAVDRVSSAIDDAKSGLEFFRGLFEHSKHKLDWETYTEEFSEEFKSSQRSACSKRKDEQSTWLLRRERSVGGIAEINNAESTLPENPKYSEL